MSRVNSFLTAAIALAGCGGSVAPTAVPSIPPVVARSLVATTVAASFTPLATPTVTAGTTPTVTAGASPTGTSAAIVGVWRGEHQCEGIVQALQDAGFDATVIIENIVGNGLLPAADSPDEVLEACGQATVLEHSHEFTANGRFFSYDQNGDQVDFGAYELVDEDTLTVGAPDRAGMRFDFTIEGDHLTLKPQLPAGCLTFECQWAIMVAMPWSGMERAHH